MILALCSSVKSALTIFCSRVVLRFPDTLLGCLEILTFVSITLRSPGVAVVPEAAARRWTGEGALSLVQLEDPWAERRLMVIVQRLDTLPSHARRLAEF